MARDEHRPIFRAAFDLALHLEKIVQNFGRYHKYTLSTELRNRSRAVLEHIIAANTASDGRQERLLARRAELEQLKVLVRLCHQSGGFATTRAYLYVSEQVVGIAKQNEGWLRSTVNDGGRGRRDRSGESLDRLVASARCPARRSLCNHSPTMIRAILPLSLPRSILP